MCTVDRSGRERQSRQEHHECSDTNCSFHIFLPLVVGLYCPEPSCHGCSAGMPKRRRQGACASTGPEIVVLSRGRAALGSPRAYEMSDRSRCDRCSIESASVRALDSAAILLAPVFCARSEGGCDMRERERESYLTPSLRALAASTCQTRAWFEEC